MESITKEAIKAIAELGINNSQTLGELFSRIYFKKDQYALFLDETNQTVELLIAIKDNNRDNVTGFFYQLTELLSVLRELEENHLIYTFPQELPDSYVLYYEGKQDDRRMQQVSHISIGPSLILQRNSNGDYDICKDGRPILTGEELPSIIFNDLKHFFSAIVFSTAGLRQYIKNGYTSFEFYLARRANRISQWAIFIAFLAFVGSPFLSVYISNKCGISTLNKEQYDELIQSIQINYRNTLDSIKINKTYDK